MGKTTKRKSKWRDRIGRAVRELRKDPEGPPPAKTPEFFDYMEEQPVIEI